MTVAADPGIAARARVSLFYLLSHGRIPNWRQPSRFTEWVQWRKLYERNPRIPSLIDKITVKQHVASELGPDWVTPTLFHGYTLPKQPDWEAPFVIKARHACNRTLFVYSLDARWRSICAIAERWCRRPYGLVLDECLYRDIPREVIVEPFIGRNRTPPVDYKIYVFEGRARCVSVHHDRTWSHSWAIYDLRWHPLSLPLGWRHRPPPSSLAEMITAAERLGRDFDFVRLDFYDLGGTPRFGEMTFYPGSGLSHYPRQIDIWMGHLWSEARTQRSMRLPDYSDSPAAFEHVRDVNQQPD